MWVLKINYIIQDKSRYFTRNQRVSSYPRRWQAPPSQQPLRHFTTDWWTIIPLNRCWHVIRLKPIAFDKEQGHSARLLHSGCQKNVPVFKRFFSTTTYAAIPLLGTLLWKAVQSLYRVAKVKTWAQIFACARCFFSEPSNNMLMIIKNITSLTGLQILGRTSISGSREG